MFVVSGTGFLDRIKELLTSPPSVSQFLGESSRDNSVATDVVLEGDRTWEQLVSL